MNAEQAWQTVLAQLQMDMPRASYDTWVRDTRPVGYENGNIDLVFGNRILAMPQIKEKVMQGSKRINGFTFSCSK